MSEAWKNLCKSFTGEYLASLLRRVAPNFRPGQASLDHLLRDGEEFDRAEQLGAIELPDAQTVIAATIGVSGELTARSSKRKQFDLAKRILKCGNHDGGIFAFYDHTGRFRLSLVAITYHGMQRQFSTFRRYTFFVDPELPNKTFLQQMERADFSTLDGILETFSLEAVSDEFYKEFKPKFDALTDAVQGIDDRELKQDFALLFIIRIIFLGFVQKKDWLGNSPKFLQHFLGEYRQSGAKDAFYQEWLKPLFFEALSSPPGRMVAYGHAPFSKETQTALQMAPYLNGELFKRKQGIDDQGCWIPDDLIVDFFDFIFQYNFTVEENELYDEELELNPEFLGIIFERITNMDQGAVYTPRVEVDLMCRLALVKWLERKTQISREALYRLFFREAGIGEADEEHHKQVDFTPDEIRLLIEHLEKVAVCDPATGSGAFEVGMLQVLEQVLENLYNHSNTPEELTTNAPDSFERKKAIIAHSLYGVEVKRWAVWINHLRLWLTLFVDMPDEYRTELKPLLPNLTFKIRTGDSLVQRIGGKTFPVQGHINLPSEIKRKITLLKQKKVDFFYNKSNDYHPIEQEELAVFRAILDSEITERQQQIRSLTASRPKQAVLFQAGPEQAELDFSAAVEAQRAALESEIAELQAQKRILKDERPFIWSIEFAEIFFDRGGFDIIIGNPPYVRQEEISDPNGVLDPGEYKNALVEMVGLDFPDYFEYGSRKPSGRSDLYTYFYIRSLRLLNREGIHVFICSNSWLDVGYGAWLQEFFLHRAPLYFVIDNHARRSFSRADINTVITVAGAPGMVEDSHIMRFVAFKQPFEEVVLSENLLEIEQAAATLRDGRFRVCLVAAGELLREGSEFAQGTSRENNQGAVENRIDKTGRYLGGKWGGKYLRAPDIFFTILEKGKGKLVPLGEIAEVRRGFTTGANDFFYLEPLDPGSQPGLLRVRNGAGWEGEIEEEFLKPVIKSPRESHSIVINPEDLRFRLFMCPKSKVELKYTRALEYIQWGEKQGYHTRSTLRSRRQWWNVGTSHTKFVAWAMIHSERHNVNINPYRVELDHNFFGIDFFNNHEYKGALIMISTFSMLTKELYGRSYGGGSGPIKTDGVDLEKMISLDPIYMPEITIHSLEKLILNAPSVTIFTECGIDPESEIPIADQEPNPLTDRKALDDIVFDALELTEEERKEVYRAVCQLVWERISKARSVGRNG
ncbi:MAG: hypothetical protein GX044_06415 [Firmicutes bacterium]|nr:hypothetical protein [Bacillota bacterium]